MCLSKNSAITDAVANRNNGPAYAQTRLNESTYLVVHNDKYFEFPFVYVKVYHDIGLAVVIDTGCGAHNGKEGIPAAELKEYIISDILKSTHFSFMVICTHCHFDHIGGIEPFADSDATIVASGHDRFFLDPQRREENSLCGAFGTKTPRYEVTQYTEDDAHIQHQVHELGLRIIHTPGHTPDSMAIYDEAERWLFVGDTCYQRVANMPWGEEQDVPIILPLQGNWKDFVASLHKLLTLAQDEDDKTSGKATGREMKLAAGHTTSQTPAVDFLRKAVSFCEDVVAGKIPILVKLPGDAVAPGGSLGDETFVWWQAEGRTDFGLMMPESFQKEF